MSCKIIKVMDMATVYNCHATNHYNKVRVISLYINPIDPNQIRDHTIRDPKSYYRPINTNAPQ